MQQQEGGFPGSYSQSHQKLAIGWEYFPAGRSYEVAVTDPENGCAEFIAWIEHTRIWATLETALICNLQTSLQVANRQEFFLHCYKNDSSKKDLYVLQILR